MKSDTQNTKKIIRDIIRNPSILKRGIQQFIDLEQEEFGDTVDELKDLARYIKANWKIIVPSMVALGVSLYILSISELDEVFENDEREH